MRVAAVAANKSRRKYNAALIVEMRARLIAPRAALAGTRSYAPYNKPHQCHQTNKRNQQRAGFKLLKASKRTPAAEICF